MGGSEEPVAPTGIQDDPEVGRTGSPGPPGAGAFGEGIGTATSSAAPGIAGSLQEEALEDARVRYALRIRQVLSRTLASPVLLRRSGSPRETAVRIRIREDGRVLEAVLEGPCEDEALCRRVREAVLGLGNLPRPPGGPLEIRVPVRVHSLGPR